MTPEQIEALSNKLQRWHIVIQIYLNPFRWWFWFYSREENVTVIGCLFLGVMIIDTYSDKR